MLLEAIGALIVAWFFWFLGWEDGWGWRIPAVWFTVGGIYLLFQ
jgi:hypothetical protein